MIRPWIKALLRGDLLMVWRARSYTRALEHGNFHKLMPDPKPLWEFIERHASIPHTERVALKLPQQAGWDLWVSYKIDNTNPVRVHLEGMYIPDGEHNAHLKPAELEHVPVFELVVT